MRDIEVHKTIENLPEFDNHRVIVVINDVSLGLKGFIAIHRGKNSRPSLGATRRFTYSSDIDALKDALRLSRTMSYKTALAGLNYGGAKGVIIKQNGKNNKTNGYLKSYAERVNCLGGRFVTGTDVGISDADVKVMRRYSKYFVGVKTDPARFTALGVYYSIILCVSEMFNTDDLSKYSIAIQGVGKTGGELLKLVAGKFGRIVVTDVDNDKLKFIRQKYPEAKIVKPTTIHSQKVDVFSPCAMYHSINSSTVNKLHCSVVAGSANNQLENEKMGELLYKKGILYAPDYVANAGGLISVVDEYENGNCRVRRITKRVKAVGKNIESIIAESKRRKKPTNLIANRKAEKLVENI